MGHTTKKLPEKSSAADIKKGRGHFITVRRQYFSGVGRDVTPWEWFAHDRTTARDIICIHCTEQLWCIVYLCSFTYICLGIYLSCSFVGMRTDTVSNDAGHLSCSHLTCCYQVSILTFAMCVAGAWETPSASQGYTNHRTIKFFFNSGSNIRCDCTFFKFGFSVWFSGFSSMGFFVSIKVGLTKKVDENLGIRNSESIYQVHVYIL